jgi:putative ABC transport system substrate-binding protein
MSNFWPKTLRRRDAIAVLAGAAMGWPSAARAQGPDRIRRVGVLMNLPHDHPDAAARAGAFEKALESAGWTIGRSVSIEYRWSGTYDIEPLRQYARELFALDPDVVVAAGRWNVIAESATSSVPIVIVGPVNPIGIPGLGLVESVPRPGGNVTGFSRIEPGFSAKWLELLTQITPGTKRAAILRTRIEIAERQFAAISAAAPLLKVELTDVKFTSVDALERDISAFASEPNGGLVVTAGSWATLNSQRLIELAAKYRLPTVYPNSAHVARGGLISYGPSVIGEYRRAADYVDRFLRGAKPADLPVQMPTEFETGLNLKTAAALGLQVPKIVLTRITQFIE